jgi:molybdopterin converting factor small subunit
MKVTIKPVAALRTVLPAGVTDQVEVELPEGATAADAAAALGIPAGHAGAAFLDNRKANLDTPLAEGQVVGLIPPLGGG